MQKSRNKGNVLSSRKVWAAIAAALSGILALGGFLFLHPQPLFGWSVTFANLSLYSDQPFSAQAGKVLLQQVQRKLSASPQYSTGEAYAIFVCNTSWRRAIFFAGDQQANGLTYYPLSTNVFLGGGIIEENRRTSPSGLPDILGRSLDHFMAHEIAHDLNGEEIGWLRFHNLPVWIREGYAEYIGSQGVFNYEESVQAFLNNSSKMNLPPATPYLRYNLLVAYLIEKKHWSEAKLFETQISQSEV